MGNIEVSVLRCLWIGPDNQTYQRTTTAWSPFYEMDSVVHLPDEDLGVFRDAQPGLTVVLEFQDEPCISPNRSTVDRCDRIVRSVMEEAEFSVVICLGDSIPSQIVVDWLHLGVFTYVERRGTMARFHQTFAESSCRARQIAQQYHRFDSLRERWNSVTEREAVVLEMLLEGVPNKTIATRLGVSQRTVETRRHNLYEKLDSRCVAEVVKHIYELDSLNRIFRREDASRHSLRQELQPHFPLMRPLPLLNPRVISVTSNRNEA
jgi:DNA-binding NarL/FixJ family response regulator